MAETGTKGENVAKGPGRQAVQVATFRQHAALLPLALSPTLQYVGGKIPRMGDTESKQKYISHVSYVTCHLSCVMCHLSLSHVTDANIYSHRPSPNYLSPYAQQASLQRLPTKKFAYISDKFINQKSSVHQEAGLTAGHK